MIAGRARWLALAGIYLLAAVVFTWPMPARMGTHLWGDRFDAWTTLWLIWQLGDTLGAPAAWTDRILYPLGYDLWSFGHVGLQLLGAPFVALGVGPVAVYNGLALAALVFSALSAHALGEALVPAAEDPGGRGRLAAGALAATVFTWNPYLYGELRAGCLELVSAGFLPLFFLALLRIAERPDRRRVLVAGAILAITGPFNWYYALFSGMLGLGVAGWLALARRWSAAGGTLAALALGLGLVLPLIPFVQRETPSRPAISAEQFAPERWARSREIADGEAPLAGITEEDLLALDALQVVLNSTTASALLRMDFPTNPLESTPGRLAWGLGLAGMVVAGRRARPLAALALGATLLTLGPYGLLDQSPPLSPWSLDHPLPYAWLYNHAPFFSKGYRPYRIGVIVLTLLAAGAAAGVARLGARGAGTRAGLLGLAALALGVGAAQPHWVEGRPARGALMDARVPEATARLAGREGAIIELPLHYQPLSVAASAAQAAQRVHRRPMLNCNQLIRRTDLARFQGYVVGNPLLGALLDLARAPGPWAWAGEDAARLVEDGFRDLVVRTAIPAEREHLAGHQETADRLGLAALRMLEDAFGPPWLDEGGLLAFEIGARFSGERAWSAARVRALEPPHATLGLPVVLRTGQHLTLGAGEGGLRRAGLWVLAEQGEGTVHLAQGARTISAPVRADGQWRWVRLEGDPGGEGWVFSLQGQGRFRVARPEVER